MGTTMSTVFFQGIYSLSNNENDNNNNVYIKHTHTHIYSIKIVQNRRKSVICVLLQLANM